jgi:signal transduction histidine kinase
MNKDNPFISSNRFDIYDSKSRFKWLSIFLAVFIGFASIFYTNILVSQLKDREQRLIRLYARTLEYTINETGESNLGFIFQEIIVNNNSIPVIVTDAEGTPLTYRNIDFRNIQSENARVLFLKTEVEAMKALHEPLMIRFLDDNGVVTDRQFVYYRNSKLLDRLRYYPYIQLSIIGIFGVLAYLTFNYSKTAEQNRIWVGLAKETAHQLGTPISSLIAWLEYFRTEDGFSDKSSIPELEKDIHRLEMITSRFSSIGSVPMLGYENIPEAIKGTIEYLQKRVSNKVKFEIQALPIDIRAKINRPLFDWVIENLCKNAIDAMSGTGNIDINIRRSSDGNVIIDVTDTGKGIANSKLKQVFQPGYTTKARGWGLGLALVKRIIEVYHRGKIFVKSSEPGRGTTFRIILKV